MEDMVLREVCEASGAGRRAIQGYEDAGLVCATGRTERGYLLYDENAVARIKEIRKLQRFGFSVKRIAQVIDAPAPVLKKALEEQREVLRKQQEDVQTALDLIDDYIKQLS